MALRVWLAAVALALLPAGVTVAAADQVDVASHARSEPFGSLKISPDGRYYAATLSSEGSTTLIVLASDGLKVLSKLPILKDGHVLDFHWVGTQRLVFSTARTHGSRAAPRPLGRLFAINHDGSDLVMIHGTSEFRILKRNEPLPVASLLDALPGDDDHILLGVRDALGRVNAYVERVDVRSGESTKVAEAPGPRFGFLTDANGVVRFAVGTKDDNAIRVFYREGERAEWKPLADQAANGQILYPLGLDAQGKVAYLQLENAVGTDEIVRYDLVSGASSRLLRDPVVDPGAIVFSSANGAVPVGSRFFGPEPRTLFFDESSTEAKLWRKLEAAFPEQQVRLTSTARAGALALVFVSSATNPGDYFLFDTATMQATLVMSYRGWVDTTTVAATRPVSLTARDGVILHGFLTVPRNGPENNAPLVLLPHGGPFGVFDRSEYDPEAQLLADAGYAVLKINFRGSGNYGRAFRELGARQWGGTMQDDLTDATRWAIKEGIADPARICIYGASYGAYAALMGVAKEPSLYRCAAGYVGVYNLPRMLFWDVNGEASENWHKQWVGVRSELGAVSPVKLARNIRVPVFLAAGGADTTAPLYHTEDMERALRRAKVPVETLVYEKEGHGFYLDANREEFYRRLLNFLAPHLGGRTAMPAVAGPAENSD